MAAPESFDAKVEALSVLVRSGARDDALRLCIDSLGEHLGRLCHALLGDEAQARECLHELMIAFYDAFPQLDPDAVASFLYGTALRLCEQRRRAQGGPPGGIPLEALRDGSLPVPANRNQARAQPQALRAALAALKPVEREVALLRYAAKASYDDIAAIVGVSRADAIRLAGRALLGVRQQLLGAPEA